eukprot:TRINITY_DN1570_c0_g1_i11.p1 TRINITY_DN1570_c0_g1~~TRINITY_DN1570_c0_g1_i11.p1  ORF type:complete len:172 (+),score=25.40 TRINITY_DN1570_c0_g1_i11:496-1011(+)
MIEATIKEGTLTHCHEIAVQTSIAYTIIVRSLIEGKSVKEAIDVAKKCKQITNFEVKSKLTSEIEFNNLTGNGKANESLFDALYFVLHCKDFADTLLSSIDFAGPGNYCPVLVGGITGALYGAQNIPQQLLEHPYIVCEDLLRERGSALPVGPRLESVSRLLAATWITEGK